VPVDGFQHARLTGETAAVFLSHDHLDDLPPARHEFAQRLGLAVGHAPRGRADGFGEVGDCEGVETIGLGELAGRAGEVADLTRIDHRQGQMRGGERACDHALVSARRLECDQHRTKRRRSTRCSRPSSSRMTAKISPLGRRQMSSRSFDTSIPMNTSVVPSLHMRARDAAPAGGAVLANGLLNPRSARAPIRRRNVKLSNAARRIEDTRSVGAYSLSAMLARIRSISACSSAVSGASVSWMASFFKSPVNLKGT
jgi:hypothetical protein